MPRLEKRIIGLETKYGFMRRESDSRDSDDINLLLKRIAENAQSIYGREFIENGGRIVSGDYYIKYCTPETSNPVDLVIYDKAGEEIISQNSDGMRFVKDKTGGTQSAFSCHENYLIRKVRTDREGFMHDLGKYLLGFLITRQIFSGPGDIYGSEFVLSQNIMQGLNEYDLDSKQYSIMNLNYRKPPIDSDKYSMLHITLNKANLSEIATYLKVGTTSLVLDLIEDDLCPLITIINPSETAKDISKDQTYQWEVFTDYEESTTAINIQRQYLEAAKQAYTGRDEITDDILARWEYVLDCLEEDPMQLTGWIDWITKRALIDNIFEKQDPEVIDFTVQKIDEEQEKIKALEQEIQDVINDFDNSQDTNVFQKLSSIKDILEIMKDGVYRQNRGFKAGLQGILNERSKTVKKIISNYPRIKKDESLFYTLQNKELVDRLITDEQIQQAMNEPPKDTRAWIRGNIIKSFMENPDDLTKVEWDCVKINGKYLPFKNPFSNPVRFREVLPRHAYSEFEDKILEQLDDFIQIIRQNNDTEFAAHVKYDLYTEILKNSVFNHEFLEQELDIDKPPELVVGERIKLYRNLGTLNCGSSNTYFYDGSVEDIPLGSTGVIEKIRYIFSDLKIKVNLDNGRSWWLDSRELMPLADESITIDNIIHQTLFGDIQDLRGTQRERTYLERKKELDNLLTKIIINYLDDINEA